MLERWTRTVIRHRVAVTALWVLAALAGLFASGPLDHRLTTTLEIPGTPSAHANALLANHFHQNVEGSFTLVTPLAGERPSALEGRIRRATAAVAGARVIQQRVLSGALYSEVDTPDDLARAAALTGPLRLALARQGVAAMVTGPAALQHDLTPVLRDDLRRGELVAIGLALLVLLVLLGVSWSALVPFWVAALTISTSIGAIYLLSWRVLVVLYVPNVVELIGLGLAIDYSLLMVHRFRRDARHLLDRDDAIVATMQSAGRTVILSGTAVTVGLATMLLMPVPFLRSLGVAGVVVPLVAVVAAVTLQPATLSFLGTRGLRAWGGRGLMGESDRVRHWWRRLAHLAVSRRRRVLVLAGAVVLAIGVAAFGLQVTPGSISAVPSFLPAAQAARYMSLHVGPGVMTPDQIVLVAPPGQSWRRARWQRVELRLGQQVLSEAEVRDAAIGVSSTYTDPTGRYTQMLVIGGHPFGAEQSQDLVRRLRAVDVPAAKLPPGVEAFVGGAPAQGVDYLDRTYQAFPWIVLAALLLTAGLLARALRSWWLAVVTALLDLVSVAAAYGAMVLVFRVGWLGSLWHAYRVSQIEGWVPVFVFATLFGLSMDYEVFIVARIREARLAQRGVDEAIVEGLEHTGGVVSAAALIMVGALAGLAFGRVAGLQELGVGLGVGVLVDATIVRGLILPATLSMLGDRVWR